MGLRPAHTEREKDFDYKARGLRRIVNIIEGKKEKRRKVA
jgi:hypothetical protein